MNNQILVSVVTLNWNGMKWLKKHLDTLSKQTYPNVEIIFIDNASTDESVSFVRDTYPRIKIIKANKNEGFATGVNLGITNSSGNLILLINNDTWIESNFIQRLVDFRNSNHLDVVAPTEKNYQGDDVENYVTKIDVLGHPVFIKSNDQTGNFYLSGVSLLFEKTLYLETGGLDNNFFMYCEEVDWFWRLQSQHKTLAYDPSTYIYHKGAGSTGQGIKANIFRWRNENTLQMIIKNYSLHNLVWSIPLYVLQNFFEALVFLFLIRPRIAYTYVQGISFNIKHLRRTLRSRAVVQKAKIYPDSDARKNMYMGPGKLHHLLMFVESRYQNRKV